MTSISRPGRRVWLLALACLYVARVAVVHAAYPERPIQLVVPFAAGGGSDILARAVAKSMATVGGITVVVDNRPGAGGNIAAVAVARAKPDGYTIMLTSPSTHGINPYIYKNAGYDPVKDFAPIGQIGQGAMVLFASSPKSLAPPNLKRLAMCGVRSSGLP